MLQVILHSKSTGQLLTRSSPAGNHHSLDNMLLTLQDVIRCQSPHLATTPLLSLYRPQPLMQPPGHIQQALQSGKRTALGITGTADTALPHPWAPQE